MMKKRCHRLILIIAFCVAMATILAIDMIYASPSDDVYADLEGKVNENLSNLEIAELEEIFTSLDREYSATLGSTVREIINSVLKGESKLDFETALNMILKSLGNQVASALPISVSIIIIAILYGILHNLGGSFAKREVSGIVYLVCYFSIVALTLYSVSMTVISVKKTLDAVSKLLGIIFPIMLTLTAALGGSGSVAAYQPMTVILSGGMTAIIGSVVIPLFFAAMIFTIASNMNSNIRLDKLASTTRKIGEWLLGIVFGLFSVFVSAKGIVGASYDSVAIKSAKFALSGYVPIVGGYMSDSFDLVMASCVLIKNSVGITALAILFLIILLPTAQLIVSIVCFRIAGAIAEPVGDKRIAEMLTVTSKNLTLLLVALLGLVFLGFITVMLIVYTCNFGVV